MSWLDFIKPIAGLGGNLYDAYNQGNTQNDIIKQ